MLKRAASVLLIATLEWWKVLSVALEWPNTPSQIILLLQANSLFFTAQTQVRL